MPGVSNSAVRHQPTVVVTEDQQPAQHPHPQQHPSLSTQDSTKPPDYVQACAIAANMLRDLALRKVIRRMKNSFLVSGILAALIGATMLFLELYEIYILDSVVCMCTGLPTAGITLLIGVVSVAGAVSSNRVFCMLNSAILLGVIELVLVFVNTINSIRDWFVSHVGPDGWQAVHITKFVLGMVILGIVFYQVCAYVKHCFSYGEVRSHYSDSSPHRIMFSASYAGDDEDFESSRPRFTDAPPDYVTVTNTATDSTVIVTVSNSNSVNQGLATVVQPTGNVTIIV